MKKLKLFATISTLCLALMVLCFGVFSATNITYTIGGSISYEVNDVFATVETDVYTSSFNNATNLKTEAEKFLTSDTVENATQTEYKYDFTTTGAESESYSNTTKMDGNTEGGIKIAYNTTNQRTYFVVISIINNGDNIISASVTGTLGENANTTFVKTNPITSLSKSNKQKIVLAFMLDDITLGMSDINFEYVVTINNGEYVNPFAELQYLNNDEAYTIASQELMNSQTYEVIGIKTDQSHAEIMRDEGSEIINAAFFFYNFAVKNIDLDFVNNIKIEIETNQKEIQMALISVNIKSTEEIETQNNKIIGSGSGNMSVSFDLSNVQENFCVIFIKEGSDIVFPFDIRLTFSKKAVAGKVEISDMSSDFKNVSHTYSIFEDGRCMISQEFSFTNNSKVNIQKIDITDVQKSNQAIDFTIDYDTQNMNVLLFTNEAYNKLTANLETPISQITADKAEELALGAAVLESYLAPTNDLISNPSSTTFNYNGIKLDGPFYIMYSYNESISDDSQPVTKTVQVTIGNMQDYKDELYILSEDGTYYIFARLYNTTITEFEVKATYGENNLPVKEIAYSAFKDTKITKIVLPDTIETLNTDIFKGCDIESFEIPKKVTTIKKGTFTGAHLGTLIIPETVTRIESYGIAICEMFTVYTNDGIDNLIIRCNNSAFVGDITNTDFSFTEYQIKNVTIYTNTLCDWMTREDYQKHYITTALYVKPEYLESIKETYSTTYLVVNDMIKAIEG